MHKQLHQNTHPTFTYRKGRIFYFRRKIPSGIGSVVWDAAVGFSFFRLALERSVKAELAVVSLF